MAEGRRRPLVMIVDDEQDVATYLGAVLADEGFEVRMAADADSAIGLMEGCSPDVVCLDLVMPQRTGAALYASIRRHPSLGRVPVVVVSGLVNGERLVQQLVTADGLEPPDGYLEKPVDVASLVAAVRELAGVIAEVTP